MPNPLGKLISSFFRNVSGAPLRELKKTAPWRQRVMSGDHTPLTRIQEAGEQAYASTMAKALSAQRKAQALALGVGGSAAAAGGVGLMHRFGDQINDAVSGAADLVTNNANAISHFLPGGLIDAAGAAGSALNYAGSGAVGDARNSIGKAFSALNSARPAGTFGLLDQLARWVPGASKDGPSAVQPGESSSVDQSGMSPGMMLGGAAVLGGIPALYALRNRLQEKKRRDGEKLASFSPERIEAFVATCYEHGLNKEAASALLQDYVGQHDPEASMIAEAKQDTPYCAWVGMLSDKKASAVSGITPLQAQVRGDYAGNAIRHLIGKQQELEVSPQRPLSSGAPRVRRSPSDVGEEIVGRSLMENGINGIGPKKSYLLPSFPSPTNITGGWGETRSNGILSFPITAGNKFQSAIKNWRESGK